MTPGGWTEAVQCKYCNTLTPMLGTKMCDSCWELDSRIRKRPWIALKIWFFNLFKVS